MSQYYNKENEFLLAANQKLNITDVSMPQIDRNGQTKIVIKCTVEPMPPVSVN